MYNVTLKDFTSKPVAILFSDLHMGPGIFRATTGDEDMLNRTSGILYDLWELARELEIDYLICAGDLYDQANLISVRAMDHTTSLISTLQLGYPLKFYCLTGNHDLGSVNIDNSSQFFSSVNVLANCGLATVVDDQIRIIGKSVLGFVPYMLKPAKAMAAMLEALQERLDELEGYRGYLVMHQTPSINTLGLPADYDGEAIVDKRITYLSGHIHKPAIGLKGRILGSPCHLSADDLGQQKYIYVLLEDGSLKAIPTGYSTVREHVVQQLANLSAGEEAEVVEDNVYGRTAIWDILDSYAKKDVLLLTYIQQHLG